MVHCVQVAAGCTEGVEIIAESGDISQAEGRPALQTVPASECDVPPVKLLETDFAAEYDGSTKEECVPSVTFLPIKDTEPVAPSETGEPAPTKKKSKQGGARKKGVRTAKPKKPVKRIKTIEISSMNFRLDEDGKKIFYCQICNVERRRVTEMKYHLLWHMEGKPFQCNICEKSFPQQRGLKKHMLLHKEQRPYPCPDCNKSFVYPSLLVNHRRIHTGERPYQCNLCEKAFRKKYYLCTHIKMVHAAERSLLCDICAKLFKTQNCLKLHMRVHAAPPRPPDANGKHVCEVCDKKFLNTGTLSQHMKLHTGDLPFVCEVCAKGACFFFFLLATPL